MNASLETILELTRQVSALAEAGEWAQAAQVDTERQAQLRAFCAALSPDTASPELIQTLTQILKLNDTLVGTVQHRQRTLVREAETIRTGQRAVAAYGSNTLASAYSR